MKKKIILVIIQILLLMGINNKKVYAALEISCDNMYLGVNYQQTLKATGASNKVEWKSSDQNVVTVSNGLITGKQTGTAYIRAQSGSEIDTCKITVIKDYVPVSNIQLESNEKTLTINEKIKINPTITPSNASNKVITYKSNNPSIAIVDASGNVTAKKVGTAHISASIEGKTTMYKVIVVDTIALKSITTKSSIEIKEQETAKLTVTYTPSNATNKKVTWKSSNTNIVTVDTNGNLKGISPGSATITIISNDGGHVATSKVTVIAIDKSLKGITLNKSELTLQMGNEETLTINYNPTYAENKNITWSSSDKKIAKVENGKITAIKPGTTEIKAISEDGNHEAICKLTVTSLPIESIIFEKEEQTIYIGAKTTLNTISTPKDTAINNPIWTSSDETIATVTNGIVTAKKTGKTTITISSQDGKITASTIVNVIEKPSEPLKIEVEGYELNFDKNKKTYTLTIGKESTLKIKTNIDSKKVTINGNRDLKNGSIITISIKEKEKITYIINIKKKQNYTIYFIAVISILLLLNIIRILLKNKKKNK